jgi:hypothetical protein
VDGAELRVKAVADLRITAVEIGLPRLAADGQPP